MQNTTKFRKATRIVLSCLMLSVLLGCKEEKVKDDNNIIVDDDYVYGTWKQIAGWHGGLGKIGGSNSFKWNYSQKGKYGRTFILGKDQSFESDERGFYKCDELPYKGTFVVQKQHSEEPYNKLMTITLDNCSFTRVFVLGFEKNKMVLVDYEPACDEGCASLFEKVN